MILEVKLECTDPDRRTFLLPFRTWEQATTDSVAEILGALRSITEDLEVTIVARPSQWCDP